MKIKGILLDAGGTLIRPIGGSFWPGPYFRDTLSKYGIAGLDWKRLELASKEGMDYLEKHHYILTEQEEREQLYTYYAIVLRVLGLSDPSEDLLRKLADIAVDLVEFEPFPETKPVLENLNKKNYRLCVVSNAWPSLERKLYEVGLGHYFDAFVISSKVGGFKPDERVYITAIEKIGLPAENLLFVDDYPEYARKARQMGMTALVISRDEKRDSSEIPVINSLEELENYL